jgi:hypothetical protein
MLHQRIILVSFSLFISFRLDIAHLFRHVRERMGKGFLAEGKLANSPDLGVLFTRKLSVTFLFTSKTKNKAKERPKTK